MIILTHRPTIAFAPRVSGTDQARIDKSVSATVQTVKNLQTPEQLLFAGLQKPRTSTSAWRSSTGRQP